MIEATYPMEQSAYLKWDPYSTLKEQLDSALNYVRVSCYTILFFCIEALTKSNQILVHPNHFQARLKFVRK